MCYISRAFFHMFELKFGFSCSIKKDMPTISLVGKYKSGV